MSIRKRGRPKKELAEFKLPADFDVMDSYIEAHKKELTDRVVECVDHAVRNNLPKVVLFKFENTPYSVTLLESEYLENIEHIYDMYIKNEYYEDCQAVQNLLSRLK